MPRNPINSNEFIAGELPVITFKGQRYVVDGRAKQVRNAEDFSIELDVCYDDSIWDNLTKDAKKVIQYEFHGVR